MKTISMLKRLILLLPIIFSYVPESRAISLYSLNSTTNELVTIDPHTGNVNVIGSLGIDVLGDGNLAVFDQQLYLLSSTLMQIDHLSGTVTSNVGLNFGGSSVTFAEGLATSNGTLYVGFGNPANGTSNNLGELALDGSISNVVDFVGADFDALAGSQSQLYSLDGNTAAGALSETLYTVDPSTSNLGFAEKIRLIMLSEEKIPVLEDA